MDLAAIKPSPARPTRRRSRAGPAAVVEAIATDAARAAKEKHPVVISIHPKVLDLIKKHPGELTRRAGAQRLGFSHHTFNAIFVELEAEGAVRLDVGKMVVA